MSCRTCGLAVSVCCGPVPVPVTADDLTRMEGLAELVTDGWLPKRGGECVFLMWDESCGIYKRRPQACRDQDPGVCLRGGFNG